MVESFPLEIDGIAQRYCEQLKMKVGQSEQKTFTQQLVKSSIDKDSVVFTDQSTSYVDLKNLMNLHVSYKSTRESVDELKWVHIAIANAKRNLLGIYHVIKENTFNTTWMSSALNSTGDTTQICLIILSLG